jgi:hypothetical protein
MQLNFLEVHEKIGLAVLLVTMMSGSFSNACLRLALVFNIDSAYCLNPFLPVLAILAQFPAIIAPALAPAIEVVAYNPPLQSAHTKN